MQIGFVPLLHLREQSLREGQSSSQQGVELKSTSSHPSLPALTSLFLLPPSWTPVPIPQGLLPGNVERRHDLWPLHHLSERR